MQIIKIKLFTFQKMKVILKVFHKINNKKQLYKQINRLLKKLITDYKNVKFVIIIKKLYQIKAF